MNAGKYVFRHLLDFVNQNGFNKRVKRYGGNYRIRHYKCWNQFEQVFFVQITLLDSFCSICLCLQILSVSAFDKTPVRDLLTLSQVNQNVKDLQYGLFDNML